MSDKVIEVENLSKLYRLGEVGTGSLAHDINRWWHRVLGKEDPYSQVGQVNDRTTKANSDWVWALKDINFEVKQGDVLGIIGRNGAGKSTLLKILSSVTAPSSGMVKVKGRIAALLEVGTGFHPELTGRDNIFLNGAILGMNKAEIRTKLDQIVNFSGCEAYLDTPVKRYSSGMQLRLAFAVAAHLEPEILIVDEVLAVGDAEFQKKCIGRMSEVADDGRTVLFVSHNMMAIQALCRSAVIMDEGRLVASGSVGHCLDRYLKAADSVTRLHWARDKPPEDSPIFFERVTGAVLGDAPNQRLELHLQIRSQNTHAPAMLAADIEDATSTVLMQAMPTVDPFIPTAMEGVTVRFEISLPALIPGCYAVHLWMGSHNTVTFDHVQRIVAFEVLESPTPGRTYPHSRAHGFIVPESCATIIAQPQD
jgi:lipopolysaccharide transport system ATP-binding protein